MEEQEIVVTPEVAQQVVEAAEVVDVTPVEENITQ